MHCGESPPPHAPLHCVCDCLPSACWLPAVDVKRRIAAASWAQVRRCPARGRVRRRRPASTWTPQAACRRCLACSSRPIISTRTLAAARRMRLHPPPCRGGCQACRRGHRTAAPFRTRAPRPGGSRLLRTLQSTWGTVRGLHEARRLRQGDGTTSPFAHHAASRRRRLCCGPGIPRRGRSQRRGSRSSWPPRA